MSCRFAEGLPVFFVPSYSPLSVYPPVSFSSQLFTDILQTLLLWCTYVFTDLNEKNIFEWEKEFGLRAMESFLYIWLHFKLWWILQYLSLWLSRPLKTEMTSIFSQDILPLSHLTSERRLRLKAMCAFSSRDETAFTTNFWHISDLKRIFIHEQMLQELFGTWKVAIT